MAYGCPTSPAGTLPTRFYRGSVAVYGARLPQVLLGTGRCRLRTRLCMRAPTDQRQKPNPFLGGVVVGSSCLGFSIFCNVARLGEHTLKKNVLFNWVLGALAAASFFYLGILVLLVSMQRLGCCPILLDK